MTITGFFNALLSTSIVLTAGCSVNANRAANELYNQAVEQSQTMVRSSNYRTALVSYDAASSTIDAMVKQYPASDAAKALLAEESRVCGLTLSGFRSLRHTLLPLAEAEQAMLPCAVALLKSTEEESDRTFYLTSIAGVYAEAGNIGKTTDLLAQALESAEVKTNLLSQAHALERIAETYELISEDDAAARADSRALQLARANEPASRWDATSKSYVLTRASLRHLTAGETGQGRDLMQLAVEAHKYSGDPDEPSPSLSFLADMYAEAGYYDEAISVLKEEKSEHNFLSYEIRGMAEYPLTDSQMAQLAELTLTLTEYDRDRTLSSLAARYAEKGHFVSAQMLQAMIENKFCRDTELWIETVREYARQHRIQAAFRTVNLMSERKDIIQGLLEVATALSELRQKELVDRTMVWALHLAQTSNFMLDYESLGMVSGKYAALGYDAKSEELFSEYIARAHELESPWRKANALNDLAAALIQLDRLEEASGLLSHALESARSNEDDSSSKGLQLMHIAENLALAKQFGLAMETAEAINDESDYKHRSFSEIAIIFAASEEYDLARSCSAKVEDEYEHSQLLDDLIETSLKRGVPDQALKFTNLMQDDFYYKKALASIALYLAEKDNFSQTFDTLYLMTNVSYQTSALIDIAGESSPKRPLEEEEKDGLSRILMDHYPMDTFWKEQGIHLQ